MGAVQVDIAILIPVFQPDRRLTGLVSQLVELGFGAIIIVDDGSGPAYRSIFKEAAAHPSVHLLRYEENMGKGRALKTGLAYFLDRFPGYRGVVTADGDGQHGPADILRAAQQIRSGQGLLLGSRKLEGRSPLRSRVGNFVTRYAFATLTGRRLADTQCGLRGIPARLIPSLLFLEGERYDFEMNVLVQAAKSCGIVEFPIETIYFDGNHGSHFRPVQDSMKIYSTLLRCVISPPMAASVGRIRMS